MVTGQLSTTPDLIALMVAVGGTCPESAGPVATPLTKTALLSTKTALLPGPWTLVRAGAHRSGTSRAEFLSSSGLGAFRSLKGSVARAGVGSDEPPKNMREAMEPLKAIIVLPKPAHEVTGPCTCHRVLPSTGSRATRASGWARTRAPRPASHRGGSWVPRELSLPEPWGRVADHRRVVPSTPARVVPSLTSHTRRFRGRGRPRSLRGMSTRDAHTGTEPSSVSPVTGVPRTPRVPSAPTARGVVAEAEGPRRTAGGDIQSLGSVSPVDVPAPDEAAVFPGPAVFPVPDGAGELAPVIPSSAGAADSV